MIPKSIPGFENWTFIFVHFSNFKILYGKKKKNKPEHKYFTDFQNESIRFFFAKINLKKSI